MTKCGDMTYASYLMRKRGECDEGKEKKAMPTTNYNEYIDRLMASIAASEKEGIRNMRIAHEGIVIEGTEAQVREAARKLGIPIANDGVWYNSSSKGWIRIETMSEEHLRRAVAKRLRTWAESLSGLQGSDFIQAINKGGRDDTTNAMLVRLSQINTDKVLARTRFANSPVKW